MNPDNILAEFERAKRALQAARNLYEDGLYEDAVSRSYYAVMHAAKAALLFHDAVAESHAAVGRLFGSVLVRPGIIEAEWADVLAREHRRRIAADYGITASWESAESLRLVEEAGAFVQRIRVYLKSIGINLDG
ncbi:MAG: hypothetical protein C3F12_07820 [Candidatus Methylomirabilota bacterium]|nr:HEPN domain-containing protein [Candidatus Methylomirabilis sp.]NJD69046.1 HEPN domain-containing protein [candidate division NC10 bacterium]PWB45967.1 MAG: hypothetical protein C3F12_07820 [candidate division NC10 bacterium]